MPHAEDLPRALDVSRFAAARQAEINVLCSAIKDPVNQNKFGVKAIPRHLRRHRKRPNLKLQKVYGPSATNLSGDVQDSGQLQQPRPTNRAMRRRPGRLQAAHEESCCQDPTRTLEEPTLVFDTASGTPANHRVDLLSNPSPMLQPATQHNVESTKLDINSAQHNGPTQHKGSTQYIDSAQPLDPTQHLQSVGHVNTSLQAQISTAQMTPAHPEPTLKGESSTLLQTQHKQSGNATNRPSKAAVAQPPAASGKRKRSREGAPILATQQPKENTFQSSSWCRLQDRSLETHLWHAKRMQMVHRWGHVLAEGAFGKGHGSRAFLHALKNSFVMHDASYLCPVEVQGSFGAVSAVLQDVSTPEQARAVATSALPWASGAEVPFMLYHPVLQQHHSHGAAVQSSSQVATEAAGDGSLNISTDNSHNTHTAFEDKYVGNAVSSQHSKGNSNTGIQQDVPQAVQQGVQQQGHTVCIGAVYQQLIAPAHLLCLEGQHLPAAACLAAPALATAAFATPGPAAGPAAGTSPNAAAEEKAEAPVAAAAGLTQQDDAPGNGSSEEKGATAECDVTVLVWIHPAAVMTAWQVLKLAAEARGIACKSRAPDLRRIELRGPGADSAVRALLSCVSSPTATKPDAELPLAVGATCADPRLMPDASNSVQPDAKPLASTKQLDKTAGALQHGKQLNLLHPASALWASKDNGILPPLPEYQISSVRQKARLSSLHLGDEGEWELEQQELQQEGKERLQVPTELQDKFASKCPIIATPVAKAIGQQGSARKCPQPSGWSLVLPAHWVLPFWLAFVHRGAKVAGQREWGWVQQELGVPSFPEDYPETQAAAVTANAMIAEQEASAAKRPKGKQQDFQVPAAAWATLGNSIKVSDTQAASHGVIPPGWWVARSSGDIGALSSTDFPLQGAPELQQQQVQHEQPQEREQQQQHADTCRCLVPVRVQVVGKGVAQPLAKLLSRRAHSEVKLLSHGAQSGANLLSHGPGSPIKPSKRQRKAVIPDKGSVQAGTTPEQGSQTVPVKDIETDLSKLDTAADVTSSQALSAAAAAAAAPAAALSQGVFGANELDLPSDTQGAGDLGEGSNSQVQSVVGVVTSGVTRGASSNRAALALCNLAALQQAQREQQQALSKHSSDRVSVAMQMQCPASTAVSDVVVHLQHNCA